MKYHEVSRVLQIDWDRLTTSSNANQKSLNSIQEEHFKCPNSKDCEECPDKHCWHKGKCQRQLTTLNGSRTCHVECLDGCKNILNSGCYICKNLKQGDRCVSKCGNDT